MSDKKKIFQHWLNSGGGVPALAVQYEDNSYVTYEDTEYVTYEG